MTSRLKRYRQANRAATSKVAGFVGELFGGVQAIKVVSAERHAMRHFRALNEVRRIDDVPIPKVDVKKPELTLAVQLVEQASSEAFKPENYEDNVRKRVLEQIQRKVEGKEITEEPAEAPKTQIIDLMEALKASLKTKGGAGGSERKPAKRVEQKPDAKAAAAPAAKRKVGGARG